jgi:UDP-glucuronate 4-epimerase
VDARRILIVDCVLVTGAAGFIGYSVAKVILTGKRGAGPLRVVGIDDLNPYYSVRLKRDRLAELTKLAGFSFEELDIADHESLSAIFEKHRPDAVLHLAAQAGVRYSLENPFAYARSNLLGHLAVLEACRHALPPPKHIYASSSSVYGGNTKTPFSEDDPVDHPVSLYAATKRADELMSDSYAHLYGLEQIGLRFFTVYGPWGRPDMAYWTFTEKILAGEPIPVFNHGNQARDFTYIDDIVDGILRCLSQPSHFVGASRHRVYNIGNNRPVPLMRFIDVLEETIGKKAIRELKPSVPGDVPTTFADIGHISRDYGFAPSTPIEEGLPKFVDWYRQYFSK